VVWLFTRAIAALTLPEALLTLQHTWARQPSWLCGVEVVLLGDFAMYWGHRLQHHNKFLWRFHAIHHTSETLDFVAAHREHPLDGLYTQMFMNLPAVLLGFSFEGLLGLVAFRGLWATFIHSNIDVPLGPFGLLFGSPRHHHLHHLRDRDAGNYANLAPWIDYLFGTHRDSSGPTPPGSLGLDTPTATTYLALLVQPFRRTPDC
jgi:sterol desaturase/sphingolipid hydroxylase (fatty acid hydroxylase superfamily)